MTPHQQVFKLLTNRLRPLGFERRRSTWWQIRDGRLWLRIHIHKFTFANSFRVHTALHVAGFEDEAVFFNGPTSHDGWFEERKFGFPVRRYDFNFQDNPESLTKCADELGDYVTRCVMPWFKKWSFEQKLLTASDSPLRDDTKECLKHPNH